MNNTNGDFNTNIKASLELINPEDNDPHPGTMESCLDDSCFNGIFQSVFVHNEILFQE